MRTLGLVLLGIATLNAACLPEPPQGRGPGNGEPIGGGNTMNPTPQNPSQPSPAPTCGAQTFGITVSSVPPNVFLVVDRSGSMSDGFGGGQAGTKWDAAQTALNNLLNTSAGKAQWGLALFPPNPSANTCGKATIDVSLQMGTETSILNRINGLTNNMLASPRGSTPTADALKTVRDSANLAASDRNNYVVLVTDGIPMCNNPSDVAPVIDELYNRTPSVKTFVVGIGAETESNPTLMNQWAEKGHTAKATGTTKYYQANDATQLVTAFDAIIGATRSCSYRLDMPPEDPTLVVGQLDGASIASDGVNGFTYDGASQALVFHGTSCDKILAGTISNVGVVYGCPPAQIL